MLTDVSHVEDREQGVVIVLDKLEIALQASQTRVTTAEGHGRDGKELIRLYTAFKSCKMSTRCLVIDLRPDCERAEAGPPRVPPPLVVPQQEQHNPTPTIFTHMLARCKANQKSPSAQ